MNSGRNIFLLDGDWQFAYTKDAPNAETRIFPDKEAYEVKMPVPAYWDDCRSVLRYAGFWSRECKFNPDYRRIDRFPLGGEKPEDASLDYLLGTGWYKKYFLADECWGNGCINLSVGGAMLDVWVWLNGMFIGTYYSCGKPFEMSLNDHLIFGMHNELVIAVSNIRKDRIGCSIRGYKGRSGGISGSVKLVISGNTQIKDVFLRTVSDRSKLVWNVKLHKKSVHQVTLQWSIVEPETKNRIGTDILSTEKDELEFETETFGMEYWSDRNPKLYQLSLEILEGDTVIDAITQNYGFRFIERKDVSLYLNGCPIFLRGTTDHGYFAKTCTVPKDESYYMHTIKALKAAGFNWMRFHTTIPAEACMNVADKLGMLIQVESQDAFTEEEFTDMMMLCRKHPSVILYCCGNEARITDEFEQVLKRMGALCHRFVPDCLYDPQEALLNVEIRLNENEVGYTEFPVPHNERKLRQLREYSDVFAPHVGVFSYSSLDGDAEQINQKLSIYQRPCLIHEAGIFDTYLNLDLERRYEKLRIGTDLFRAAREYMEELGLLQNAPLYYQNSCRWMKILLKYALEKARKSYSVSGYDFLGAIDCHWHRSGYAVGIMNEFYELKYGFSLSELQQFNGENLILSNSGHKRNLYVNEKMDVELYASLYGGENLENGFFFWSLLDDNNHVRLSGEKRIPFVENGVLASLGNITIGLDSVRGIGEHFKLLVSLKGGIYDISNEWDYWIFNKMNGTMMEGVEIVNELTAEDVKAMENGRRILLLGAGPFENVPVKYQISAGGRVNGNCATVVYDHPLMRDFPHEGFCDWQLKPLFDDGSVVVFNHLDVDFCPIIEVVSSYKMIRKQAGISEIGVGKGGMIVCPLNVGSGDPAAGTIRYCMVKYLASDEFRPKVKMTSEMLLQLMDRRENVEIDFSTDEAFDAGGHVL